MKLFKKDPFGTIEENNETWDRRSQTAKISDQYNPGIFDTENQIIGNFGKWRGKIIGVSTNSNNVRFEGSKPYELKFVEEVERKKSPKSKTKFKRKNISKLKHKLVKKSKPKKK
jgi:hypothetical protein